MIRTPRTAINRNLTGVSLNDLPDVFGTYGFWGGSNVSDYPSGVDPAGAVLITFPTSGSTIQLQLYIKSNVIYTRYKNYNNVWSSWVTA